MGTLGAIVGAFSPDYRTLVVARILQGLSSSAYESIVVSVIGDMYFVHQRGLRISLFSLVIGTIGSSTAIVSGWIITNMGWHWLFILLSIFAGIQLILMFFLCPETTYVRSELSHLQLLENFTRSSPPPKLELGEIEAGQSSMSRQRISVTLSLRKKSYWKMLSPWSGKFTDDSIIRNVLSPFVALFVPGPLYVLISSAFLIAAYVATSFILSAVFSAPPYLFSAAQVGYLAVGPMIGGLLGTVFTGLIDGLIVKWITNKNGGIYEPEFRLFIMIPGMIFSCIGLFMYGYVLEIKAAAELTSFVQGVMVFGIIVGTISTTSYLLDAYRELSSEIFIMSMVTKNFLFYGMTFFVNNWVAAAGPRNMFNVFGAIAVVMYSGAFPLYVFGKQLRASWTRSTRLRRLCGADQQ